jgi:hypothetical protein
LVNCSNFFVTCACFIASYPDEAAQFPEWKVPDVHILPIGLYL